MQFFNNTLLIAKVSGGNKPNFTQIWTRQATQSKYFGVMVPIWWISSKYGKDEYYNRGNGTVRNVILKSKTPTFSPTNIPTNNPITYTPIKIYQQLIQHKYHPLHLQIIHQLHQQICQQVYQHIYRYTINNAYFNAYKFTDRTANNVSNNSFVCISYFGIHIYRIHHWFHRLIQEIY